METIGYRLSALVEQSQTLKEVRKKDLTYGDMVFVKTGNSVYSLRVVENNFCIVSGGWFDRKGLSPVKIRINGCTWGGSAIKMDIVAACGLRMEFANRVVTTSIRKIFVLPHTYEN